MARTYPPLEERFWSGVQQLPGEHSCWRWVRRCPTLVTGKGRVCVRRLSYEMHIGPVPKGWCVRSTCGSESCVRPDHLEAFRQRGVTHPRAKLNEEQVRAIRRRREEGALVVSLAKEFGVSPGTITKVARREFYKDVE